MKFLVYAMVGGALGSGAVVVGLLTFHVGLWLTRWAVT